MTARWDGGGDVRLVRGLAARAVDAGDAATPRRHGFAWLPLLILVCAASAAVGAAMLREALTGPVGVFWWLGVVLAFVLGSRWQLAQDRRRVREQVARSRSVTDAYVAELLTRNVVTSPGRRPGRG